MLSFLLDIGDLQVCQFGFIWLLRVLVDVLSLHEVVKACLSLPSSFTLDLLIVSDSSLIHHREGTRHIILRVSVEFTRVSLDLLA